MRALGIPRRQFLIALGVLVAAAFLGVILRPGADSAATENGAAADDALVQAPGYLESRPGVAALLALAGQRLQPSLTAELSMLSVAADNAGVERVLAGGASEVTAAIRTTNMLVTADEDGVVRVWRPHSGVLLGRVRAAAPLVALADTDAAPLLAAADSRGGLSLLDLSNPTAPRLRQLPVAGDREPPMALAFSDEGVEILSVSRAGEVEQLDTMTGRALSRWSLREVEGEMPWARGAAPLELAAASFDSQAYGADGRLLVGMPDGAVARVELKPRRGRTMIPAGSAPGRITAVAEVPYGHEVAAAATGGYMTRESGEVPPTVQRGPEATGVAFDSEDTLWVGSSEGASALGPYGGTVVPFSGRPVAGLTAGAGGVVAVNPGGAVSVLGAWGSGLTLPEVASSSFAAFAPDGRLLIEEGPSGYVYRLLALKPGHGREYGQEAPNPEAQSYEPDPDWWPEEEGFSAEAGAIDDEFAVSGGQDPTGTAVVLVWDAESGEPLRRLPLSTGSVDTLEPSVVTEVLLLPGKHLLAAYSAAQQLIAIWSTDSWEQVASVPVGSIGSMALSPDESQIVAIGGDTEELEWSGGTKLVFVDVDSGSVASEVARRGVSDAVWSPDGDRLAAAGTDGKLQILSADGEEEIRAPIQLEGEPIALAWRPDGEEVAISLRESALALADPATGAVSPLLPSDGTYSVVHHLDWSEDGRFLVAAVSRWREDGEGFEPAPAQIWTVDGPRLERRMCQLAGGALGPAQWHELVGAGKPRPLCRASVPLHPLAVGEGMGLLDDVDIVFRSGSGLFAGDRSGHVALAGRVQSDQYPSVNVSWGPGGLAWSSQGEVGMLELGSRQASAWTCLCSGAALHGGDLFALASDGRQLFRFLPGQDLPRPIALHGRPGLDPKLVGYLGDQALVAGYASEPTRATPSTLYLIDSGARVSRLARGRFGAAHPPFAQSPAGDVVAFVSTISGGACYSPSFVGIVTRGRGGGATVAYPRMPGGEDPQIVRSLQVRLDGTVEAAIAPVGCDDEGVTQRAPADATRYVLRGGRWSPTPDHGFDVLRAGSSRISISTPRPYEYDGDLTIGDGEEPSATDVEQIWASP